MYLHTHVVTLGLLAIVSLALLSAIMLMAVRFLRSQSAPEALTRLKDLVFWCAVAPAALSGSIWLATRTSALDTTLGLARSREDQASLQIVGDMLSLGHLVFTVLLAALWAGLTIILGRLRTKSDSEVMQPQPAERS